MSQVHFRRKEGNFTDTAKGDPDFLEFLKCFDPIGMKYGVDSSGNIPLSVRSNAGLYENQFQYGNISKQEYGYIQENLKLVYSNGDDVHDDILAYYRTEERIIHRYLAIPQLDKMFDEDFFNFEWDMHVEQNFREHRNDYYRDHFIHQIRDMYMMLVFLDKFNFYRASMQILRSSEEGKIQEYVRKSYISFRSDTQSSQYKLLEELFIILKREGALGSIKDITEYIDNYFYKYVIYASSILASLFHDMGYPICHFLEVRHRLSDYSPTLYMFTQNTTDSFDKLASILNQSLLFTIVSPNQIRNSLQINKEDKYNHGSYSAIAFLLQFYITIFSLTPEKRCAIELAALAIYNHTYKFRVLNGEKYKDNIYYAPFFPQNPVSFLLRFCDDLQEWDRRYFEISQASDLLFCENCGVPLLRYAQSDKSSRSSEYYCLCGNSNKYRRPDVFVKRKIYLVSVSDVITVDDEGDTGNLNIHIHYDYYKLLMLSNISAEYARHRNKELLELRKLLKYQNFKSISEGNLPFKYVNINFFMTANPILIKVKTLEEFLRNFDPNHMWAKRSLPLNNDDLIAEIRYFRNYPCRFFATCPVECLKPKSHLYHFLATNGAIRFYLSLLQRCLEMNSKQTYWYSKYINYYRNRNPLFYDALTDLTSDCIRQYEKIKHAGGPDMIDSAYYQDYIDRELEVKFYRSVGIYTELRNNFNRYSVDSTSQNKKYQYISYYKDLRLFYEMNEKLREL